MAAQRNAPAVQRLEASLPAQPPNRSALISVRLTDDELADLRAAAIRTDLSVADFLRRSVNHMMARGSVLDPEERSWAAGIGEELRRAGINLNQVARAMNAGRIGHTDELRNELHEHIDVVRVLAHAYAHLSDGAARVGRLAANDLERGP